MRSVILRNDVITNKPGEQPIEISALIVYLLNELGTEAVNSRSVDVSVA